MAGYRVVFSKSAQKQFMSLDASVQLKMQSFINRYLSETQTPRQVGKALQGSLAGLWRYRVGNYRLVCQIRDDELEIVAVKIGHRGKVYAR